MKFLSAIILSVFFVCTLLGQNATPISQAEYVKMLYQIEAKPSTLHEVVDAIRLRGIDFKLTSGLRSLTASKSKNDPDLKRTLEEALRRLQDPIGTRSPDSEEAAKLLGETRKNTLEAIDEMPDFVVKQLIRRGISYAGTNTFRSIDHLIVGVSYLAEGDEEYRLLSINGIRQADSRSKKNYSEANGTSSTGEFVTVLATIFKPASETQFTVVDMDQIDGQRAVVYDFSINKDKARQMITAQQLVSSSTISGMKGRIWIDQEKARVLKIESIATEIPSGFPVTAAKRLINYSWVKISDKEYLLPSFSEVRLTSQEGKNSYETRNQITFKDYQKYGTEVTILPDDEPVLEEPPAPPVKDKPLGDN